MSTAPPLPGWLSKMLPFERSVVEVDGHRIHVMESGRGVPVLCMHGNPTWGFLYRKVATALIDEPVRVIMPDLIGLGFSDHPTDPAVHTLEHHITWMGKLIDALDLADVTLVVQDWGGPIGTGAFMDRSDRLSGLVVLNTILSEPREGFRPTLFHRFGRLPAVSDLAFRVFGFPQVRLSMAQSDKSSIRGDVSRAYRYPLRSRRTNQAPLALTRMVPDSMEHPSVEPLRRIGRFVRQYRGPVEIVWGDRDPVLGSARNHIARMLPDAPVTRTGAGHFLQEEVPDEIAAAIRRVAFV
ncbi:MAG: alpha/beta fold hydrolase [Acidimicrobiia bacterium]